MKPSFICCRRMYLLLFSFFIFSIAVHADPGTEEVSAKVLQQFASSYRTAENVTWKVTKEFSKASFIANNKLTEVFYNRRNRLIGTGVCITLQELPAGAAENIDRDYAKCKCVSVIQYTTAQGETSYFVQLENSRCNIILRVDEDGQLDCVKWEGK